MESQTKLGAVLGSQTVLFSIASGCDLASTPLFVLELSELLAGSQTCGQAFVSPEGRRAKGKRTFRVPIGPGARSAREVCFYGTA